MCECGVSSKPGGETRGVSRLKMWHSGVMLDVNTFHLFGKNEPGKARHLGAIRQTLLINQGGIQASL